MEDLSFSSTDVNEQHQTDDDIAIDTTAAVESKAVPLLAAASQLLQKRFDQFEFKEEDDDDFQAIQNKNRRSVLGKRKKLNTASADFEGLDEEQQMRQMIVELQRIKKELEQISASNDDQDEIEAYVAVPQPRQSLPAPRPVVKKTTKPSKRPKRNRKKAGESKRMTSEQKKQLYVDIGALTAAKLSTVLDIIHTFCPHAITYTSDEAEIEIEKLDDDTLWSIKELI